MEDEFEELRVEVRRDRLIQDLAALTGETADQVVLQALQERLARLTEPSSKAERKQCLLNLLDTSLWRFDLQVQRRGTMSREEEDRILGYGPEGV